MVAQLNAAALDAELDAAEVRGQALLKTGIRAVSAAYAGGRVMIELATGCAYAFPAALIQDLAGASDADLADVEVDGAGFNLHWPALDVDLYVPALVAGIFGTKAWMTRELARRAGLATSPAKAAAARENGAKGGRPRKAPTPQTGYATELLCTPMTVFEFGQQPADQSPVILKMRPLGTIDIRANGAEFVTHFRIEPGGVTITEASGEVSLATAMSVDKAYAMDVKLPAGMVELKAKQPATAAEGASRLKTKRRLMVRKKSA